MDFSVFFILIITIIVHISFAKGIYQDTRRIGTPSFVSPIIWVLATVIGGVFAAAIYWVMHHSRLNPSVGNSSPNNDFLDT